LSFLSLMADRQLWMDIRWNVLIGLKLMEEFMDKGPE